MLKCRLLLLLVFPEITKVLFLLGMVIADPHSLQWIFMRHRDM